MNTTLKKEDMVKEIQDAIKTFLTSNGGLNNGYETLVEGEIQKDHKDYSLRWMTPAIDNLTGKYVKKLGSELYNKIYNISFNKYEFDGKVKLLYTHIEYGCVRITIELIDTYPCYL